MNLNTFAIRNETGMIDVEATMLKFQIELESHIELQNSKQGAVENAVNATFAKFPGATLNVPSVVSLSFAEARAIGFGDNTKDMGETFKVWGEDVRTFLANSNKYKVSRGRNGGVKEVGV